MKSSKSPGAGFQSSFMSIPEGAVESLSEASDAHLLARTLSCRTGLDAKTLTSVHGEPFLTTVGADATRLYNLGQL
eukprot:510583-Amphidinium_carterae.1